MILMDRLNLFAPEWSHVVSLDDDVGELETFREAVGAPPAALQLSGRWPHLDLKGAPRERALAAPGVVVVERSADLVRMVRDLRGERRPPRGPPRPDG